MSTEGREGKERDCRDGKLLREQSRTAACSRQALSPNQVCVSLCVLASVLWKHNCASCTIGKIYDLCKMYEGEEQSFIFIDISAARADNHGPQTDFGSVAAFREEKGNKIEALKGGPSSA